MSIPSFASMVSFTTGATCFAADWNTNYAYVVSALSGASRDITINSLVASHITCATITPTIIGGNPIFPGSITISGAILGDRALVIFGGFHRASSAASVYLILGSTQQTSAAGVKMHRSGSVVGYSFGAATVLFTSSSTANVDIKKNGTSIMSSPSLSWGANNSYQSVASTFGRGSFTFSSGDILYMQGNLGTIGNLDLNYQSYLEVVYDT